VRKVIVVAMREYLASVRTKAFIITIIAMPVMMGGSILAQVLLRDKVDIGDKRIAVLDQSGFLHGAIADAAEQRNATEVYRGAGEDRRQIQPRFVIEAVDDPAGDPARVSLALSERVRKKELFAYLIIEADALHPMNDAAQSTIGYHSDSPTYDDFLEWVRIPLNERIHDVRLRELGLDPVIVSSAMKRAAVRNLGLVSLDEQGRVTEAQETNRVAGVLVPVALMMLMFMVIMVGASPLLQGVLEEKMQRIAEVLLGSMTPFELMSGKLLGSVGVSLSIVGVYMAGAFYALHRSGYGSLFPVDLVVWFVIYQSLAVLLYGSLFMAIGAAVSDMKEAQSVLTPVMFILVAPMFVWFNVIREPGATFAVVLSLIPPATPMLMLVRQAVPPGIPLWQPMAGVILVLLTTAVCVFIAGRVFRVGILMQGQGAKLRDLARWIIHG